MMTPEPVPDSWPLVTPMVTTLGRILAAAAPIVPSSWAAGAPVALVIRRPVFTESLSLRSAIATTPPPTPPPSRAASRAVISSVRPRRRRPVGSAAGGAVQAGQLLGVLDRLVTLRRGWVTVVGEVAARTGRAERLKGRRRRVVPLLVAAGLR